MMTLQNLSALLPALSAPSGAGRMPDGSLGASPDAEAWARVLAGFEPMVGGAQRPGQSAWAASLQDLQNRLGETDVPPDLAAQFQTLFAWLESEMPPLTPGDSVSSQLLPEYQGDFWPSAGEMILLLQGISPWGEDMQPEHAAWVEQVGPVLGIPELSRSYEGSTLIGREMTAVKLADAAGADVQRAFVDAWLGRHEPQASRNVYDVRWASASGVPAPMAAAQTLSPAADRTAELLSVVPELIKSARETPVDGARGGWPLQGLFNASFSPDQRDVQGGLARTDTAAPQVPVNAVARDFGPLLGSLASQTPQSASAELRAAGEQALERVVWMAGRQQGVSEARLQLHPAHLGKLDIRLELQGREASVQLTVYHSAVREAVEAMLPRLREQLEGQGVNLGDASVFDSSSEEQTGDESARLAGRGADAMGPDDEPVEAESRMQTLRRGDGLLDAYA